MTADVLYSGIESAITANASKPDANSRIAEAVTAWTGSGVLSADAHTPPVRDVVNTVSGAASGAGAGSSAAAGPVEDVCLALAVDVLATGAVGIPLAKQVKESFKPYPLPVAAAALTRAVLQVSDVAVLFPRAVLCVLCVPTSRRVGPATCVAFLTVRDTACEKRQAAVMTKILPDT